MSKDENHGDASSDSATSSTPATHETSIIEQIQEDLKELRAFVEKLSSQNNAAVQSVQVSGGEPGKLSLNVQAEVNFHAGDVGGDNLSWGAGGTSGDEPRTGAPGGREQGS